MLAYPARGVVRASLVDFFFERSSHWHWHGHVQVMVAIEGELVVHFRENADVVAPPMHAVAIPPNTWHIPAAGGEGRRVLMFDLRIAASPANDLLDEINLAGMPRMWRCHARTLRRGIGELRRLARQAAPAPGAAIVRAAWAALVIDAAPAPPDASPRPERPASRNDDVFVEGVPEAEVEAGGTSGDGGVDRRVLYVEKQMRADVAKPYDAAGLAAAVQLSVSQMGRLFTRHRGVSPLRRLQDFRLAQAEQYLAYSTMSVKQIAARCGFGSTDHFARQFRDRTGLPPRDYRLRHRPPTA